MPLNLKNQNHRSQIGFIVLLSLSPYTHIFELILYDALRQEEKKNFFYDTNKALKKAFFDDSEKIYRPLSLVHIDERNRQKEEFENGRRKSLWVIDIEWQ